MNVRRSIATLTVAAAAAAVGLTATPAEAASAFRITKVYFDSPGSDTRSNTSLNAEYVVVKNVTGSTKTLTKWSVRDKTGYTYVFPTTTVGAYKTITLRTGRGSNTSATRYWQRSNYVWNNTGDSAYLRSATSTLVQTCTWGGTGAYKNC